MLLLKVVLVVVALIFLAYLVLQVWFFFLKWNESRIVKTKIKKYGLTKIEIDIDDQFDFLDGIKDERILKEKYGIRQQDISIHHLLTVDAAQYSQHLEDRPLPATRHYDAFSYNKYSKAEEGYEDVSFFQGKEVGRKFYSTFFELVSAEAKLRINNLTKY